MLYFIFAALIVLLDQLFKYYISMTVDFGAHVALIPGVIRLTYVENTGAAFGLFSNNARWVLVAVSGVCTVVMIVVLLRYKMRSWGRIGLAMVLGGAVGNLVDRVAIGYVVDMFEFEFVNFAVFNIADIFITVGGILFILYYILDIVAEGREKKAGDTAPAAPEQADDPLWPDIGGEEETLTETQILEEFDLHRRMSESDSDD